MSIIEKGQINIGKKEELKQDNIMKNNQTSKDNKQLEYLKKESIFSAKELIKKLLQKKLNNSLLKLETNSSNQINTLKNTSKNFSDFSKLIANLIKNVEESKKKKDKSKKSQILKRVRKVGTEPHHLKSRSRTIESNLINFKSKAVFEMIENNKKINNNLKTNIKRNLNVKKLGNRTLTNFRINDEKKEDYSQKQNKFQNFIKNNNIIKGPATPRGRMREKIRDKNIDKTFSQIGKMNLESFATKVNNSKKIEYVYEKNIHSHTIILNPLLGIDERIEKYNWNKNKKINKNKQIKGAIYKNGKKSAFIKINNQLDKINDKSNKPNSINKIIDKEKESSETQVANIVKLVDNLNQNLNKILSENTNTKKSFIKKGNKIIKSEKNIEKMEQNVSKISLNAIKNVDIKDVNRENNLKDNNIKNKEIINDNKSLFNTKENEKIHKNTKNVVNINIKEKEIFLKDYLKENNINNIVISYNFNILKNYFENENRNILILKLIKKNKSQKESKLIKNNISLININEIKYNKSSKEVIIKNNNQQIKKSHEKKYIDNSSSMPIRNEKYFNNLEIIKKIRNKMKENNDKINKMNRNKENNEKLNAIIIKNNKTKQINEKDKLNIKNIKIENNDRIFHDIKDNIQIEKIKNYLSKSEKKLTKLKINNKNMPKKRKSHDIVS